MAQTPHLALRSAGPDGFQLTLNLGQPPAFYTVRYATDPGLLGPAAGVWTSGVSSAAEVTLEVPRREDNPLLFFQVSAEPLGAGDQSELSQPEVEQTTTLNGVTVTVPAGTFSGATPVAVLARPPEAAGTVREIPGLETTMTYEVQVGEQTRFEEPLQLELPYDPERLNPDVAIEDAVTAAYWLPEEGNWVSVASEVDPVQHRLRLATDHLSIWAVRYVASGYRVLKSDLLHARVAFNPEDRVFDNVAKQFIPVQDYAQIIADAADGAAEAYRAAGFEIPEEQWFVIVDPATTVEAEWAGRSGDVYIPTNFEGVDQLRYEIGHELFHAVQNLYYNVYSAGMRKWWHEACATYASYALFLGRSYPLRFPFSAERTDFCNLPLSTVNDRHEYATGEFLAFLFAKSGGSLDFKSHFDAMEGYGLSSTLRRLEDTVRAKTSNQLERYYRFFAADYWLNRGGALPKFDPLKNADGTPAGVQVIPADERRHDFAYQLTGGYTAQLGWWRVDAEGGERKLVVRADLVSGKALVDVHVVKDFSGTGFPWPKGTLTKVGDTVEVTVPAGHYLCLVAVNCDSTADSLITGTIRDAGISELTGNLSGRLRHTLNDGVWTDLKIEGTWRIEGDIRQALGESEPDDWWPHLVGVQVGVDTYVDFELTYTLSNAPTEFVQVYPDIGSDVVQLRPHLLSAAVTRSEAAVVERQEISPGRVALRFRLQALPDVPGAGGHLVFELEFGLATRSLLYRNSAGGLWYDSGWTPPPWGSGKCQFEFYGEAE
ncbi:MAG: hypothetical protein H7A46_15105 [Verrucomicrobiales bacterium]|nr:hypothetical protein [Verrucomicrobiales bacterium]